MDSQSGRHCQATNVRNTHRSVIGSGRAVKKVSVWKKTEKGGATVEFAETEPWNDNE